VEEERGNVTFVQMFIKELFEMWEPCKVLIRWTTHHRNDLSDA
jgi:hypothetical protein